MKKAIIVTIIALLFTAPSSWADTSPCNGLLSLGLYNATQRTDVKRAYAVLDSKFCSADFSTLTDPDKYQAGNSSNGQVLEIEASYDLLIGSFVSSDPGKRNRIIQEQTRRCKNNFSSGDYFNNTSEDARLAYQGSLEAWNQCNVLNNVGVKFNAKASSDLQGFTVDLSAPTPDPRNPISIVFTGLSLEGGNATCTTQLPSRSTASISGKLITVNASTRLSLNTTPLTINCKREMLDDGMGINGKYAEATGLHFDTSAGSVVVPLAAIGKVPRVDYDKAVGDVRSVADYKIGEIATTLTSLGNSVTSVQSKLLQIQSKQYITTNCRISISTAWDPNNGASATYCSQDEVMTGGGGHTWCNNKFGGLIHFTAPTDLLTWTVDQTNGDVNCSTAYAICCKKS